MHAIEPLVEMSVNQNAARNLDLVLLYPGAIEGGVDQIIIDLVPDVVRRPGVKAWAFERSAEPVPVIALLLDVEAGALADIVDDCEDMLSSRLTDEPALVMQSLVDMPGRAVSENLPWGVRQSTIDAAAGAAKLRQQLAQEQAISEVVLAVVRNVRTRGWDRKSVAPTLMAQLLQRVVGEGQVAADAFRVMQHLLTGHPASEALTRQFRMNAHKLVKANVGILLQGAPLEQFTAEINTAMNLVSSTVPRDSASDISVLAAVWRRMAGGIGFSVVEAAYIACLVAANGRGEQ